MQVFCKHPSILSYFDENLSAAYVVMPAGSYWED